MDVLSIVLVAVGLSMDCFAVAVASGISGKGRVADAFKIGAFFGGFQAGMPILGWYGGLAFVGLMSTIDHWIAFALLALIGGKMVYEAMRGEREGGIDKGLLNLSSLIVASVATSIDSLAIGLSFSLLAVPIIFPAAIIGVVCFSISLCGAMLGKIIGGMVGEKVKILGGLILIGIGLRILLEHYALG